MAFKFCWIFLLSTVCRTHGFLGRNIKRTSTPDEYFSLNELKWRLGANSMRGMVEAVVEVSDHDDYNVRWHAMQYAENEDGSTRSYTVPLASALTQDVYSQRYWSSGVSFISSKIMYHPVPLNPTVDLVLEIAYKGYGANLYYFMQLPVDTGHYPQRQTTVPDVPVVVSHPEGIFHFNPGQDIELKYEAKTKGTFIVTVYRAVVAADQSRLIDAVDISEDPSANEVLDIAHTSEDEDDWTLTTVTLDLQSLQAADQRVYHVFFKSESENSTIVMATTVIPQGQNTLFDNAGIHMSINSCDEEAKVTESSDHVKFEFQRGRPYCVICQVINSASEEITRNNIPVGGGPTHAMYWYDRDPDTTQGDFVVYGQSYQSYSFDGTYTCSARGYDGSVLERDFEIVLV